MLLGMLAVATGAVFFCWYRMRKGRKLRSNP
jgi:hypothetical protein